MSLALILEDDKEIRLLFSEALSMANFEVVEAASVREATALAAHRTPDIAFIDINMPGQSGLDFLRHLKSTPQYATVRTIVVTANALAEEFVQQLGVDLFLVKPVSLQELLTLANRLVGKPS